MPGNCYLFGWGYRKDPARALQLFQEALLRFKKTLFGKWVRR